MGSAGGFGDVADVGAVVVEGVTCEVEVGVMGSHDGDGDVGSPFDVQPSVTMATSVAAARHLAVPFTFAVIEFLLRFAVHLDESSSGYPYHAAGYRGRKASSRQHRRSPPQIVRQPD